MLKVWMDLELMQKRDKYVLNVKVQDNVKGDTNYE